MARSPHRSFMLPLSSQRRTVSVIAVLLAISGCTTEPVPPDRKVATVEVSPKSARIWIVGDSEHFTALVYTQAGTYSEVIPVSWVARDKSLLKVTSTGVVTSLKKGGSTYVVATAGGVSDSAFVEVPAT